MRIRVSTLGRVRCDLDDRELTDLPGQRLRCALFVYLAVERIAARETLQNLFWPDRDDERGRGALKQTLFELRRAVGEPCLESRGDEVHAHANVSTDVHDFERAVESKDWQAALDLYGGEFLRGFSLPNCKPFEFWADRRHAHAARLHRIARRARIAELLAHNDSNAALIVARRWVELEPLEDEAQHKLIELLAASGERAEALRQADNYERLLDSEALQPLDATKELVERLRSGEAVVLVNAALTIAADDNSVTAAAQHGTRVSIRQPSAARRGTTRRRALIGTAAAWVSAATSSWRSRRTSMMRCAPSWRKRTNERSADQPYARRGPFVNGLGPRTLTPRNEHDSIGRH